MIVTICFHIVPACDRQTDGLTTPVPKVHSGIAERDTIVLEACLVVWTTM